MPSPFPGMNPYLEQPAVWQDFHQAYVSAIRNEIARQVRPEYLVKLEEMVFIHEPSAEERLLLGRPDVSVTESPVTGSVRPATASVTAALTAKLTGIDIERHSFIEIRDRQDNRLVTALELLSPSNKKFGPDREQYIQKRAVWLHTPVNVIEIDLLRAGERLPLSDVPPCDYLVMVSRPKQRPDVQIWPVQLRGTLPTIPIPLRATDPEAVLDLQSVFHAVYDAAGYEDYIYRSAPEPALTPTDMEWVQGVSAKS